MDYDTIYNGATADGVKAITDALELSAYEHKKLERHKKLSELADEDVAYMIRKNVNYLWVDYYFDGAKDWLSIKAQKYDKRKKYSEKDAYEYLVDKLKEIFQVDTCEIIRMCYEGYEQYSRWIEFTTDSDYVFHMTVPVIKRITPKLMAYVNYGKIALGYYKGESYRRVCGASYNAAELKPVMDEILTSEEHKKHLSKIKE
jgi:hypothetical protein